jgi:hypothetical protein
MSYVYVSIAVAVAHLVAGGYLGYRYGRKVEAKAQAALEIAKRLRANI